MLKIYEVQVNGWIRNYLNDLLCIPLLLFVITGVLRLLFNRPHFQVDKWQILFAFLMVSIAFEWWAPQHYAVHTGDVWDVLAYGVGGIVFWFTQRFEFQAN